MVFEITFDVGEDECINTLRDNGYHIEDIHIKNEYCVNTIHLIQINSFDDIKRIQKTLDMNPYPTYFMNINFFSHLDGSEELTYPCLYVDND